MLTEKQLRTMNTILRYYDKELKKYIKTQADSAMLIALQHEKNERLAQLTERFNQENSR